jgi:membrane protein implicated in regulation of membrane protease activity
MAFIIGTAVALLFLDGIWRILVIAGVALIELAEIGVWLRWRKVKATTGAEGIIGMKGIVLTPCRPEGQVRVKGQIWRAECVEGADEGDEVVVEKITGLRLIVARA